MRCQVGDRHLQEKNMPRRVTGAGARRIPKGTRMNKPIVVRHSAGVNSDAPPSHLPGEPRSVSDHPGREQCSKVYHHPAGKQPVHLDDNFTWSQFLETIGSHALAYGLGRADARDGRTCIPELYFLRRIMQVYYCKGYVSVKGQNDTTRFFLKEEVNGYFISVSE
jgi:hypothetical protein